MTRNAVAQGGAKTTSEESGEADAPFETRHVAGVEGSASTSDTPHIIFQSLPVDGVSEGDHRTLRRVTRRDATPAWTKKFRWYLSPIAGLSRFHDEDFEEHSEQ